MSKLLLDENPLLIMPQLACKIGLNESIVLQQIHYWIKINEKAKINYHDGYTWTYDSYEKWKEQFPFWSVKTIQRTIKSLEDMNLIVTANYNKLKIDRTKWYRINHEMLENLENEPIGQNDLTKACSSGQNDQMDMTKSPNGQDNLTKPLPETSSEISSKIINIDGNRGSKRVGTPSGGSNSIPFYDYLIQDVKKYKTSYQRDIVELIIYYYGQYYEKFGEEHFRYTGKQLKEIYSKLDEVLSVGITDPDFDKVISVDTDSMKDIIDKHFQTKYKGDMSWTLLSFLNDKVLKNRAYELGIV